MASKIDALCAAKANAEVVRLKSEIATSEAMLAVLRAELEIARETATAAKVEA